MLFYTWVIVTVLTYCCALLVCLPWTACGFLPVSGEFITLIAVSAARSAVFVAGSVAKLVNCFCLGIALVVGFVRFVAELTSGLVTG